MQLGLVSADGLSVAAAFVATEGCSRLILDSVSIRPATRHITADRNNPMRRFGNTYKPSAPAVAGKAALALADLG